MHKRLCYKYLNHIFSFYLGRYQLFKFTCLCHNCGSEFDPFTLEILLSTRLWPCSLGKLSYFIEEDVFLLWDAFRKRMPGTSEKSFLDSLNDLSVLNGRVCTFIYFSS